MHRLIFPLCLLFLGLTSGCGSDDPAQPTPPRNKKAVIGIAQEPDSLDPLFGEMMVGTEIRGAIFRTLAMRDHTLNLRPVLAEEIPTIENGGVELLPDGRMRTTWRIRKGYMWDDGMPVTAEDFIFAHRVIMSKDIPVITRDVDRRIGKMEAPNPYTLVVTWKQHFARANDNVHFPLPKHVLEPVLKQGPKAYRESFFQHPARRQRPVPPHGLGARKSPHPGTKPALSRKAGEVSSIDLQDYSQHRRHGGQPCLRRAPGDFSRRVFL